MKTRAREKAPEKGPAKAKRQRPAVYHIGGKTLHPIRRLHLSAPVPKSLVESALKSGELVADPYPAEQCVEGAELWRWLRSLKGAK